MNKSIKMSLLLVSLVSAGASWAAATNHTADLDTLASSSAGTASHQISGNAKLSETVTLKLSKNVLGAYDISAGGGLAGVAAGNPYGKGNIYPNGTTTDPTKLQPVKDLTPPATAVNTTAAQTAATAAMS